MTGYDFALALVADVTGLFGFLALLTYLAVAFFPDEMRAVLDGLTRFVAELRRKP
jgi:hypothetical protein